MKKLKVIVPSLIIALLFTGCFQSPETILKNASEKMSTLDNYHMDMTMDMSIGVSGLTMDMSVKAESDIDEKNGVGVMDITMNAFGESETAKTYLSYKDGKTTTYTEESEVWYKEETQDESLNIDFDIFSNLSNIEEVEGEKGTYKISLTEEQLQELMGSMNELGESAEVNIEELVVTVTVKDGYISKIVMSMPMSSTEDGVSMTADAKITIEFSKFNEVENVSIPENVVKEAIDKKIYDIQVYVDDYIYEIEWDIYGADDIYSYTNTTLEYDGPAPSRVEVTIEDGMVKNGIIDIEGYRVTIFDGQISDIVKFD